MLKVEKVDHGSFSAFAIYTSMSRKLGMGIYLYTDGRGMIDTASRTARRALTSILPELKSLERVYITHHHEDHIGGAALLKRELGVEVFAPPQSIPLFAEEKGFELQLYRVLIWGRAEPFEAQPLPDEWEFGGMHMRTVPAFGHAFDQHVFFADEAGYLFSADLVLLPRTYHMMADEDLAAHVRSLKRVAELPIKRVFCAHRGASEPDLIFKKLDFYKEVAQRVKSLYKPGMSMGTLARKIAGRVKMADVITLWHYSRLHLMRKMVELLENEELFSELFDY